MKKLIVATALGLVAVGAMAQGQFTFANKNLNTVPAIDAKVFNETGAPLAGTAYWAQAYIKLATDPDSSYAAVGAAVNFRTGTAAGYIVPVVITTTYPNNTAVTVQMRAWDSTAGNSFAAAQATGKGYGQSTGIELKVAEAPTPPADMIGLASFSLVPEPSTLALGVLGAAALFLRRRS
jgi:hypothetical protein